MPTIRPWRWGQSAVLQAYQSPRVNGTYHPFFSATPAVALRADDPSWSCLVVRRTRTFLAPQFHYRWISRRWLFFRWYPTLVQLWLYLVPWGQQITCGYAAEYGTLQTNEIAARHFMSSTLVHAARAKHGRAPRDGRSLLSNNRLDVINPTTPPPPQAG